LAWQGLGSKTKANIYSFLNLDIIFFVLFPYALVPRYDFNESKLVSFEVFGTTCLPVNRNFGLAENGDHVAMHQSCLSY